MARRPLQFVSSWCALLATLMWAVPALPCVSPRHACESVDALNVCRTTNPDSSRPVRDCCASKVSRGPATSCCAQSGASGSTERASGDGNGCPAHDGCKCPPGCPAPCGGGKLPCAPAAEIVGPLTFDPLSAQVVCESQCAVERAGDGIFHPPRI